LSKSGMKLGNKLPLDSEEMATLLKEVFQNR